MKAPNPDGTCPNCGGSDFTLCEDFTQYSIAKFEGGEWATRLDHVEMSEEPDSQRLFCIDCGEYLQVPEELPT